MIKRYTLGARAYDVMSMERPIYGVGRRMAISQLALMPGATVLDVGCGTGLNFPYIFERIGKEGRIIGVDASESMLAIARRKVSRCDWNVDFVTSDAAHMKTRLGARQVDAVICTYALSIIDQWREVFDQSMQALSPGGHIAIVDMALPTGVARFLQPLARFACITGGADINRHPWQLIPERDRVFETSLHSGHVNVAVGRKAP